MKCRPACVTLGLPIDKFLMCGHPFAIVAKHWSSNCDTTLLVKTGRKCKDVMLGHPILRHHREATVGGNSSLLYRSSLKCSQLTEINQNTL